MKKIAIVTGASAGLGVEFAKQLDAAKEVEEIWLIARRKQKLQDVAAQLKHSTGIVIPMDLRAADAHHKLEKMLRDEDKASVAWLINNAGYGQFGKFAKTDLDVQLNMIDLNCRTLTAICAVCIPFMNNGDKIVNVGSSAGFLAMPMFSVYASTKSYVFSFSQALAAELQPQGITVTCVCPGPVETEFGEVAQLPKRVGSAQAKFTAQADDVVEKALADARKGKPTSIFGMAMRSYSHLAGFLPRDLVARFGNVFAKRI